MSVPVVHEDVEDLKAWGLGLTQYLERCCLCRTPTPFWYRTNDVALCEPCAAKSEPADIPDKPTWLAKERALTPRLV